MRYQRKGQVAMNQSTLTRLLNQGNIHLSDKDYSGLAITRRRVMVTYFTRSKMHKMNLTVSHFGDCYFREADLSSSDMHLSIFVDTDFSHAQLGFCDLRQCVFDNCDFACARLHDTDLRWAKLDNSNLRGTDFTGAALQNTCLGPENRPNAGVEGFKIESEHVIGYRTQRPIHKYDIYKEGEEYKAPWFSTSTQECHPGLYLYPTVQHVIGFCESNRITGYQIIKVRSLISDIHKAGKGPDYKWRTKKFTVIGPIA